MEKGYVGKFSLLGRPPSGILPVKKVKMCSLLSRPAKSFSLHMPGVCLLLTAAVVLSGVRCSKTPGLQGSVPAVDTLTVLTRAPLPCGVLDIFVFEDTLTRKLEKYERLLNATAARLPLSRGDKVIVALANAQGEFARLPQTFDELEKVGMRYAAERMETPLMSGMAVCSGGDSCCVELTPLLCSVRIESICFEADAPLKGPVAYLENVSAYCELLRQDGFYPSETIDRPDGLQDPMMMVQPLPKDIGSTEQHPGTTLWCYPNESPDGPGTGPTRLCISGLLAGERRVFSFALKPLRRGDSVGMQIVLQ